MTKAVDPAVIARFVDAWAFRMFSYRDLATLSAVLRTSP